MVEKGGKRINPDYAAQQIDMSIEAGIKGGVGDLAGFTRHRKGTVRSYVDPDAVRAYAETAAQQIRYDNPNAFKGDVGKIERDIRAGIISGELLTEKGKEYILDLALRQQASGFFGSKKARKALGHIGTIREVAGLAGGLYDLAQRYQAKTLPQKFYQDLQELSNLGFLEAAAKYGKRENLLTEDQYYATLEEMSQKAETGRRRVESHLEQMLQTAAVVLATIGIGFLFFNNQITGNVIGIKETNLNALTFGLISLFIGIFFLIFNKKKKDKFI